ncbi:MAG TPA: hypothetical protein VN750_02305 [Steroidobacteraceae bacterium]|nr:hypothetical protein [Steroidobacteraceae bacterium]
MRNANSVILLAVAAGTLAGCHTAPPTVSDNVMACGKIADTAQRYRCYDSLNTSMRPAPSARVANASAPAGAAPAPALTSASAAPSQARAHGPAPAPQLQSGTVSAAPPSIAQVAPAPSENQVGEEYLAPAARTAAPAKAITEHASIASLNEIRPKIYLIKLSNGQVWRHEGIETMAFFSVGDDVTIKRYLFGSYHMSSPATGGATNWVRVTRVE